MRIGRTVLIVALILLTAESAAGQGFTMRFSGDIIVPPGTVHEGSAVTMNGRIEVAGTLRGDAITMNGDVLVTGTVTGSVRAFNGDVTLASTAVVDGDVWTANGRVDRQPGAQVRGRVRVSEVQPRGPRGTVPPVVPPAQPSPPRSWPGPWGWGSWSTWWPDVGRVVATWTLIGFIVMAAIFGAIFPSLIRRVADALHHSPGESLLAGIALWILLPPLVVALVLSVIGIPAVAFLPLAVMVISLIGFTGVAQLIGDRVLGGFERQHTTALEAVVGAALLGVLAFIPGLGWLAILLATTWGTGGVLLLIVRRMRPAPGPAAS